MTETEIKLTIGGLLHDFGKIIERKNGSKGNHGRSGYEYLTENNLLNDKNILDIIRYHHISDIDKAELESDSLAYVVYMAECIAASIDQMEKNEGGQEKDILAPLEPVFNILNGNSKKMYYRPDVLTFEQQICYPVSERKEISTGVYTNIITNISDTLRNVEWNTEYIDSFLEVLESNLSFIPSLINSEEVCDISLYDHLKLTAAFAVCIYKFIGEKGISDYREYLYTHSQRFCDEDAFLLASLDISGIQDFIYTIASEHALKNLRARSFYLEILMEHSIDMILESIGLSRVNLLYSGGGHCYFVLPNTKETTEKFYGIVSEINKWFIEQFDISLFMAGALVSCSGNTLQNRPEGTYNEMFMQLSEQMSKRKLKRYDAKQIRYLNSDKDIDYFRECKVCKKTGKTDETGRCDVCQRIETFSKSVLYAEIFSILKNSHEGLPLPGDCSLVAETEQSIKERQKEKSVYLRAYGKNKIDKGIHISTKLRVGDYTTGKTFEEYAVSSEGIKRIGVLRADVDNLGKAIVSGFSTGKSDDRYQTLSRTATFSRQLSLFFKHYINIILSNPVSFRYGNIEKRDCTIVYSGGDDLFIVGSWNDIIGAALDIRHALKKFSEDTLSISAGIGIYDASYPIDVIAREVARAEQKSKDNVDSSGNTKNSITLFENHTYNWNEFEEGVLGEKLETLENFFTKSNQLNGNYGKNYLYNLYELLQKQDEKINFARYVYILSRMEPDVRAGTELKDLYSDFSGKMLAWIQNSKDKKELETAILLYVYLIREREEA